MHCIVKRSKNFVVYTDYGNLFGLALREFNCRFCFVQSIYLRLRHLIMSHFKSRKYSMLTLIIRTKRQSSHFRAWPVHGIQCHSVLCVESMTDIVEHIRSMLVLLLSNNNISKHVICSNFTQKFSDNRKKKIRNKNIHKPNRENGVIRN